MNKIHKYMTLMLVAAMCLLMVNGLKAHCEIPCGIYDDPMRFEMMEEHAATIEKSMRQIEILSGQDTLNYNQLVRWVINKEDHADKLSEIVTEYFMKQRVSPVEESQDAYNQYVYQIVTLHKILVYSMNCKQTTDLENVNKLREYIEQFHSSYFKDSQAADMHDEHGHSH